MTRIEIKAARIPLARILRAQPKDFTICRGTEPNTAHIWTETPRLALIQSVELIGAWPAGLPGQTFFPRMGRTFRDILGGNSSKLRLDFAGNQWQASTAATRDEAFCVVGAAETGPVRLFHDIAAPVLMGKDRLRVQLDRLAHTTRTLTGLDNPLIRIDVPIADKDGRVQTELHPTDQNPKHARCLAVHEIAEGTLPPGVIPHKQRWDFAARFYEWKLALDIFASAPVSISSGGVLTGGGVQIALGKRLPVPTPA